MNKLRNQRQAGFTLSEILVAVAIFSILMIAALLIYDRSNRSFRQGVENANMQQATRVAFEKVVSEVRMAGFDYDRDGTPSEAQQQPDEQIEYAGVGAITFRGNLDYFTDVANEHGLEPAYTSTAFPVVTTANNEIVTFALKSEDPAANVEEIRFWADIDMPRSAHVGGSAETEVVIGGTSAGTGYDLCTNGCNNPPYTLYRITLNDDGTVADPVPIAENIRSLQFSYYTDSSGTQLVPMTADATQRDEHGAIGGAGQYDPSNIGGTASYADRQTRGDIRAVRVQLTGMTQNPDLGYNDPTDTAVPDHRTYRLETLIVPRNLGLRGSEDPHLGVPGPPQILSVCTGDCDVTRVTWAASTSGTTVTNYYVCYDTSLTGGFGNCPVDASTSTSAFVPNLSPGTTYYFKVKAKNSEGLTISENYVMATIKNATTPEAVDDLQSPAADASGITLTWSRPTENTDAADELSCIGTGTGSTDGSQLPSQETLYYWIWRGTSATFQPDPNATKGADYELAVDSSNFIDQGSNLTFVDNVANKRASASGPANCTDYWYRIQVRDKCTADASHNVGNDVSLSRSEIYPALADNAIAAFGQITSTAVPARPATIAVDTDGADASNCDFVSNTCRIKFDWSPVTTDTDGNPIAIDTYRIKRYREALGVRTEDPVGGLLHTGALLSGTTYTDTTAQDHDPSNPTTKYIWYYTVEAVNCSEYGAPSDEVKFPICTFNSAEANATGALTGSGAAGDPWVLAGGDVISVTSAIHTITKVVFTTTDGGGNVIAALSTTDNTPADGFQLGWLDQADGETYTVTMQVTDSNGCMQSPSLVRYVTDQAPAGCYPAIRGSVNIGARSTLSGQVVQQTVNINVENVSSIEDMTLTGITFTFVLPAGYPGNANFTLDDISFSGVSDATDRAVGSHTVSVPPGAPTTIALNSGTNAAYPFDFRFKYRGDRASAFTENPITSLCIEYTLASEPGVTKKCNVIGTTTNNPISCN